MADQIRSYVAECFWPGVSRAQVEELDLRAAHETAVSSGSGPQVRYHGSMLIPHDEVVFCFFDGPSAIIVEAAARRAQIPFARIVESTGIPQRTRLR